MHCILNVSRSWLWTHSPEYISFSSRKISQIYKHTANNGAKWIFSVEIFVL